MEETRQPNQFDEYTGRPFAEWPRLLQAITIVICLNDHDESISNEFIRREIDRLRLLKMSDEEIAQFRGRHLLHHLN